MGGIRFDYPSPLVLCGCVQPALGHEPWWVAAAACVCVLAAAEGWLVERRRSSANRFRFVCANLLAPFSDCRRMSPSTLLAEYYEKVTSTRKYEDRLATLEAVRNAGISVCAGGIIGLGEEELDRVGLLHQARAELVCPPAALPRCPPAAAARGARCGGGAQGCLCVRPRLWLAWARGGCWLAAPGGFTEQ